MNHGTTKEEPVRLLFEMTREDNPRLYDDLIRFNKGTKRVNRLRFLAHEGLLAQNWTAQKPGSEEFFRVPEIIALLARVFPYASYSAFSCRGTP